MLVPGVEIYPSGLIVASPIAETLLPFEYNDLLSLEINDVFDVISVLRIISDVTSDAVRSSAAIAASSSVFALRISAAVDIGFPSTAFAAANFSVKVL